MIRLRPHHIMCFQGYEGKGYSKDFIENMDKIYEQLEEKSKVKIVFSTDDVCRKCPNKKLENICETNDKVLSIDSKVIKYLMLEERVYTYKDLIVRLKTNINEEIMQDICGRCAWYTNSKCKNNILNL
ncbi:DUF1284 domain-containing protein [Clostridium felsineum]|uniref:DUF1284 domain-containing protein n=1 Tax=Clostridium felsineum TaxID=36839 RepID=UPI00214DACBC|nr:DUF1284 domain-containing protein [Clostridium felsineum]MCR3757497.1 DUF1284 domain-containing protein [Clostridium felsineum]